MSKTRAIRFSEKEDAQIEEFLRKNSFFDFSTLARMAILAFLQNPKINVQPIENTDGQKTKRRANGQSQHI